MASCNEEAVVSYLSYFCGPDSPGHNLVIEWINKTIPEHSIINFASDWLDGLALSSLVNTFLPGTMSLEEEDQVSVKPLERVKYVMKAAREELNIDQSIDSHQFISKNTEPLQRMAYITQFYHLKPPTTASPSPLPPTRQSLDDTTNNIQSSSSEEVAPVAPTSESTFSSEFTEPEATNPDFVDSILESSTDSPSPPPVDPEKFELPVSNWVSYTEGEEEEEKPRPSSPPKADIKTYHQERKLREEHKSDIDNLFASADFDFDSILKEIDDIGKDKKTTIGKPVKSSENLEMDFDFSSDAGGTTSSSCQSPVPQEENTKVVKEAEIDVVATVQVESTPPTMDELLSSSQHDSTPEYDDANHIDQGEEIIQVTYVSESQLSTTASPEPHSEYTTTRTPSPELSPSPSPPLPLEDKEDDEKEEEKIDNKDEGKEIKVKEREEEEEEEEEFERSQVTPLQSPLSFPEKCKVEEASLKCGIVNKPVNFIVDCSNAGRGRLEVIIEDANGENLEADGAQLKTNVFRINFLPVSVGAHRISVLFGECDVPNSPFLCQISDPLACTASGPGLDMNVPVVNKDMTFIVDTLKAGPGSLQATFSGDRQPSKFHLLSCADGVSTYQYLITIPGEYSIDITWAGHHIRGSPFQIIVPKPLPFRPDACTILEHPRDRAHVGSEIKTIVDASAAGYGELKAMLVSPKSEHTCNVSEEGNKIYTVTAIPSIIGKHSIILQYGGEEIPQSPLVIYVNNPKLVKVDTKSISQQPLPVNKQFSLPINTKECGEGILSVKIQTSTGIEHARVQRKDNHNYIATYIPTTPGEYSMEIFYDNKPCLSSPLIVNVSRVCSIEDITLVKTLPTKGNCFHLNKMVEFHVHAPNREPDKLKLSAVGSHADNKPYTNISPTGGDKYTLQLRATRSDDYLVSVTYDNVHLNGSPFNVQIRSPPRPNKVTMFDPVIPLYSSQPLELVFDISLAGKGSFTASAVNSKGRTMPVYVEQVNSEIYRVAFVPQVSDTFMVTVLYGDRHVNGSPFRVLYKEQEKTPPVCIHFEPPEMSVKGLMGAAVHGRNCGRQEATVVQYERGKYQVSFSPSQPDLFDLHMYWFDCEIEGSPFEIDLLGNDNESSEALVDSIPYCGGEDKVGMLAATAAGRDTGPIPVHLSLPNDEESCCVVEFNIQKSDSFDINLFWNGKPLKGMPVNVQL